MTGAVTLSFPMRIAAGVVGGIALISLVLLGVAWTDPGSQNISVWAAVWSMAQYFTVLTNLIVGVVFLWSAIKGRWLSYSLLTASVLWIAMVGAVYHLMLAADHNPQGLLQFTNICHHTVVPLGAVVIWALISRRTYIPWVHPLIWVAWPAAYTVYVLVRGGFEGSYPYYFIDPAEVGWSGVVASQAMFSLAFLALGVGLRFKSNWLKRL